MAGRLQRQFSKAIKPLSSQNSPSHTSPPHLRCLRRPPASPANNFPPRRLLMIHRNPRYVPSSDFAPYTSFPKHYPALSYIIRQITRPQRYAYLPRPPLHIRCAQGLVRGQLGRVITLQHSIVDILCGFLSLLALSWCLVLSRSYIGDENKFGYAWCSSCSTNKGNPSVLVNGLRSLRSALSP